MAYFPELSLTDVGTSRQIVLLTILAILVLSWLRPGSPRITDTPVHGFRFWFETSFLLKARFVMNASQIIESGYNKFKDVPFVVRRFDADITVLPIKYLDELRLLPVSKLSAKESQAKNFAMKWTATKAIHHSSLHVRVLNNKLNHDLPKFIDLAHDEMDYVWDKYIPQPDKWTEIDFQTAIRNVVCRMSARIFMGFPACRDERWLNAFSVLDALPIAPLLPSRWKTKQQMRVSEEVVRGLLQKHTIFKEKYSREGPAAITGSEMHDTLMGWMFDNASEEENSVTDLAARACMLTLASIHTTAMTVSNLLFDLCDYPEWFEVLRREIEDVTERWGPLDRAEKLNIKQWLAKLEKMDSFFIESQRLHPAILLAPQRVAIEPLTLKDGTTIPAGTWVAWAGHQHANDAAVISNPATFDPMRSYRKRHSAPGLESKYAAGQADMNSLAFGYGTQACPGCYFAVGEIKMILARLLIECEFKYPPGKSHPKAIHSYEIVHVDPGAKLMARRRKEN
ncbi:cytochrome P450 [Xylariaceae sp. FL0255]|nr:cytochrome P450 [Xylariaceae sp. FL0255]